LVAFLDIATEIVTNCFLRPWQGFKICSLPSPFLRQQGGFSAIHNPNATAIVATFAFFTTLRNKIFTGVENE